MAQWWIMCLTEYPWLKSCHLQPKSLAADDVEDLCLRLWKAVVILCGQYQP